MDWVGFGKNQIDATDILMQVTYGLKNDFGDICLQSERRLDWIKANKQTNKKHVCELKNVLEEAHLWKN